MKGKKNFSAGKGKILSQKLSSQMIFNLHQSTSTLVYARPLGICKLIWPETKNHLQ